MAIGRIRKQHTRTNWNYSSQGDSKPPYNARLDYSKELTKGLQAAWLFNEGVGNLNSDPKIIHEAHGFENLGITLNAGTTWTGLMEDPVIGVLPVGSQDAMHMTLGDFGDHIPLWDFSRGITVEARMGGVYAAGDNSTNIIQYGSMTGGVNQRVFSIAIQSYTTGLLRAYLSADGTALVAAGNTATLNRQSIWLVWRPGANLELWASNPVGANRVQSVPKLVDSAAFAGPIFVPNVLAGQRLTMGSDAGGFSGTGNGRHETVYEFLGIWNRALSVDELQERWENPWGSILHPGYRYVLANVFAPFKFASFYRVMEFLAGQGQGGGPTPPPPPPPTPPPGFTPTGKPFRVFLNDLEIHAKQWGSSESYGVVRPLGGETFSGSDGAKI